MKKRRALTLLLCVLMVVSVLMPLSPEAAAAPDISAESAVVIEFETGTVLYEKDADKMMVPASMTKVMTAYIIFEELEAGNITLETQIPVSDECARISRDRAYPTAVPLTSGSVIPVDTLLKLILIPSASASCIAAAEYISGSEEAFVERMNATAARLGMTAEYENCHGAKPHYITAASQAMLIREFIHRYPEILDYTSMTSMEFNGTTYSNTNKLLSSYYYEGCDGFKTGTISEAGYCLSSTAVRNGQRVIAVVMKADKGERRHLDSAAVLDYGFSRLYDNSLYFNDIAYHWARTDIEALARTSTALNVKNGQFRPDEPVTRSEFAVMLLTALEPIGMFDERTPMPQAFSDIHGSWAEDAIMRAAAFRIVSGTDDGRFLPNGVLTREQAMVMIDNSITLPDAEPGVYADGADISSWALSAAERVTAAGIFRGSDDGRLLPQNTITRAEAAVVVSRILGMY